MWQGLAATPGREPTLALSLDAYGLDLRPVGQVAAAQMILGPGTGALLTGPGGAGKTRFLAAIAQAYRPHRGQSWLFGRDTARMSAARRLAARRRIAFLPTEPRFLNHLSVWDNLILPLRLRGALRAAFHDDADQLLRFLELSDQADAAPTALPRRARLRLAFARAVISKPDLLLLDEPYWLSAADFGAREARILAELLRAGAACLAAIDSDLPAETLAGFGEAAQWPRFAVTLPAAFDRRGQGRQGGADGR